MTTATARASLAVLMLCVLPPSSHADVITFDFSGPVYAIYDPFGLVGSLVTVGDPVRGTLRYDTASADGYSDDPSWGKYLSPGWITLEIDGLAFEFTSRVLIDVLHHANGNQELFQVLGSWNPFIVPSAWPASLPAFKYTGLGLGIGQSYLPYDLLSSDALPRSLDLARADFASGEVGSGTDDLAMYYIQFRLTTFQSDAEPEPEPVPEPGAFGLLGAGLALALSRYRGSRGR